MLTSRLRLYSRLQLAAHHWKKAADRALLDAANITTAQAAVLVLVSADREVRQREIAAELGLNESAVTAMVERLMKLGYLDRARSASDGRAWDLFLTSDGRRALDRIERPFREINAKIEASLGEERVRDLVSSLNRLVAEFELHPTETAR